MSHQQQSGVDGAPAAAAARVADVNPAYTIGSTVRCAETLNDRVAWTAESDGTIRVRALPKGTELKELASRPRAACSALLYLEPLQHMWAAFDDGYVRVYSAVVAEVVREFAATETPQAAVTAMIEIEGMVFVAGEDGAITQWDCESLRRCRVLPGHMSAIRCLGCYLGPSGSVIFSGGDDSDVAAWDPYVSSAPNSGADNDDNDQDDDDDRYDHHARIHVFSGHEKGSVRAIEVLSYANQMWTAGDDATVRVWNLESLTSTAVLRAHTAPVTSLLSIESRMWSGDKTGAIVLWDINSCTALHQLTAGGGAVLGMRKMQPSTLWKVWTASAGGTVQCWNAETVPIVFDGDQRGGGGGLTTRRASSAADAEAWRQLQRLSARPHDSNNTNANSPNGDRAALGVVDLQRLADEIGYERARNEVQRELQTQQLLEEQNAQLKRAMAAAAAGVSSVSQQQGGKAGPASAVIPADGSLASDEVTRTTVSRRFPGGNWDYALAERHHELEATFRDELGTALGVPAAQITRVTFAAGSLVASAEVAHASAVPPHDMQKRVDVCGFDRLRRLHDRCRTTPKTGLDAAEADIAALEERLSEEVGAAPRASPEPRMPGHPQMELRALQAENAVLQRQLEELRQAQAQAAVVVGRSTDGSASPPPVDRTSKKGPRPSHLGMGGRGDDVRSPSPGDDSLPRPKALDGGVHAAATEQQLRSLQADYAALKTEHDALSYYHQSVLKPAVADLKRSNGERGVDIQRLKAAMEALPEGSGGAAADSGSSPAYAQLKEEHGALETYLRTVLKPAFGDLDRACAEREVDIQRLQDKLNAQPSAAPAPAGDFTDDHERLKEEYEALNNYFRNYLRPYVADLKRARAEREADIRKLKAENAQLKASATAAAAQRAGSSRRRSVSPSMLVEATSCLGSMSELEDAANGSRSVSPSAAGGGNDVSSLRRQLRKTHTDAAAKGTALRRAQQELDELRRARDEATEHEGNNNLADASISGTGSGAVDAAVAREQAAKDAELSQLRAHISDELEPEIAQLQQLVGQLQDALEATAADWGEDAVRNEKMGEAVEAMHAELARERAERQQLARQPAAQQQQQGNDPTDDKATASTYAAPAVGGGAATVPTAANGSKDGGSLEAQNLALAVRLADASAVIAELNRALTATSEQLESQQQETQQLLSDIADARQRGSSVDRPA